MIEFLFAAIVFPLAFAGLALGMLAGRHGISGSCGGLNRIPGVESDCAGACRSPGRACPKKAR
ncbi:MAG: (Na+)-NQR maturation NqrM [Thiohalocapsa sp.]|nr:(Na+)-NQR maturation NqrM [Thiohalocapsa sp.]MCF7989765.1 (Na+)-NQR maturation NqrM [Thiohalocapsa sp.]